MKPILYFFGSFNGQLKSYPLDHSKEILSTAIKHSKNSSQIILIRKGNLLYYCYMYRVNSQQLFGICLCLDCIYTDIHKMFQIFDAIYARLVQDGKIVGIDSKGYIKFLIKAYSEEAVEIQEVYSRILRELDLSENNSIILPPIDLSVSIDSFLELSLENDSIERIIDASKHYCNLYIVRKQAEIERITAFSNVVKGLCKEKESLKMQIREDQEQIEKLKRQKKQTTIVLILLGVIFVGGFAVYNYATNTKKSIEGLSSYIVDLQNDSIRLENELLVINDSLVCAHGKIRQQKEIIKNKRDSIVEIQTDIIKLCTAFSKLTNLPLVITDVSVANTYYDGSVETEFGGYIESSTSMFLKPKISYYGLTSGYKDIYIKMFNPSGILVTLSDFASPAGYTNSYYKYISKGYNCMEFGGIGGEKRGHWGAGKYKYEFYFDGQLIGSFEFYVN